MTEREKLIEEMTSAIARCAGPGGGISYRGAAEAALVVAEQHFAEREATIRAEEREACAAMLEGSSAAEPSPISPLYGSGYTRALKDAAAAIRARWAKCKATPEENAP